MTAAESLSHCLMEGDSYGEKVFLSKCKPGLLGFKVMHCNSVRRGGGKSSLKVQSLPQEASCLTMRGPCSAFTVTLRI